MSSTAPSPTHVRRHTRAKPVLATATGASAGNAQDATAENLPSKSEAAAIAATTAARRESMMKQGFQGLEPLTAEPDEVFQKLSVKAAEEFERTVRDAHMRSQNALRALVSTQYPEMLGTASTVIDMAESARSLLEHTKRTQSSLGEKRLLKRKADDVQPVEKPAKLASTASKHGMASTIKLFEVSIAQANDFLHGKAGKRGSPLTLHSAWSHTVARASWGYLSESYAELEGRKITEIFPITEELRRLLPAIKDEILQACEDQLRQESSAYQAHLSHLTAICLLQGQTPSKLLKLSLQARETCIQRLVDESESEDVATSLTRFLHVFVDAAASVARAFIGSGLEEDSGDLIKIFEHISDPQKLPNSEDKPRQAQLSANSMIDRALSRAPGLLDAHLPEELRNFIPYIPLKEGQSRDMAKLANTSLEEWCDARVKAVFESPALTGNIDQLSSVMEVSEMTSAVHQEIHNVTERLTKTLGSASSRQHPVHQIVTRSLATFRQLLQRRVDERLVGLYREQLDDIAQSFTKRCQQTLIHGSAEESSVKPLPWLFADSADPLHTSDLATDLGKRLGGRTPTIDSTLAEAENQAAAIASQMTAFWDSQKQVDSDADARESNHGKLLREQFAKSVQKLFDQLKKALVGAQADAAGDDKFETPKMLAGVAASIANSAALHQLLASATLTSSSSADVETHKKKFLDFADTCLQPWVHAVVEKHLKRYTDQVEDLPEETATSSAVSAPLLQALQALSSACLHVGPALNTPARHFLDTFASGLSAEALPSADLQLLVDALPGEAEARRKLEAELKKRTDQITQESVRRVRADHRLVLAGLLPDAVALPLPDNDRRGSSESISASPELFAVAPVRGARLQPILM